VHTHHNYSQLTLELLGRIACGEIAAYFYRQSGKVCASVCMFGTPDKPAETAEPIDMLLGGE